MHTGQRSTVARHHVGSRAGCGRLSARSASTATSECSLAWNETPKVGDVGLPSKTTLCGEYGPLPADGDETAPADCDGVSFASHLPVTALMNTTTAMTRLGTA